MKAAQILKVAFSLSIVLGFFIGCSDDGPEPGCFQEQNREIVTTITNAKGTIRGPIAGLCEDVFTIEPDEKVEGRPLGLFFPCNLTDEFQVDGAKVVFSGYVYESFETEVYMRGFF